MRVNRRDFILTIAQGLNYRAHVELGPAAEPVVFISQSERKIQNRTEIASAALQSRAIAPIF